MIQKWNIQLVALAVAAPLTFAIVAVLTGMAGAMSGL
jgi:hypothetical protein